MLKIRFQWRKSDSEIYNLIYYLRLKYSVFFLEVPKNVQANVEVLIPPDEKYITYELNTNKIQNVCFQLVHLELEMGFTQTCYYIFIF